MTGFEARRGRGAIPWKDLAAGDSRLLQAEETLFLALRGRASAVCLMRAPEEVFGRNEVKIDPVHFLPTDYLGHACLHCAKPTAELQDFLVCLRAGAIVAVLHERCFKRWFVMQDKAGFGGYRFGLLVDSRVASDDGVTKLLVPGAEKPVLEVAFQGVDPIDYNQLADPGLDAEAAYVRRQGEDQGASGEGEAASGAAAGATTDNNILFCPHCDHPNNIPFLETEGAHACVRCSGRFGVKIVRL